LQLKLQQRRSRQELINQGIMPRRRGKSASRGPERRQKTKTPTEQRPRAAGEAHQSQRPARATSARARRKHEDAAERAGAQQASQTTGESAGQIKADPEDAAEAKSGGCAAAQKDQRPPERSGKGEKGKKETWQAGELSV
ncbi:hypothetical protein CRUP_023532, partial [Coryphaenoides rupestris]